MLCRSVRTASILLSRRHDDLTHAIARISTIRACFNSRLSPADASLRTMSAAAASLQPICSVLEHCIPVNACIQSCRRCRKWAAGGTALCTSMLMCTFQLFRTPPSCSSCTPVWTPHTSVSCRYDWFMQPIHAAQHR